MDKDEKDDGEFEPTLYKIWMIKLTEKKLVNVDDFSVLLLGLSNLWLQYFFGDRSQCQAALQKNI